MGWTDPGFGHESRTRTGEDNSGLTQGSTPLGTRTGESDIDSTQGPPTGGSTGEDGTGSTQGPPTRSLDRSGTRRYYSDCRRWIVSYLTFEKGGGDVGDRWYTKDDSDPICSRSKELLPFFGNVHIQPFSQCTRQTTGVKDTLPRSPPCRSPQTDVFLQWCIPHASRGERWFVPRV